MSAAKQAFGALGERVAERWLRRQGWRILDRRFRSGHRDLDLVAERDGVVAFVEVKARRGLGGGDPVEAVGWRKQRELVRSAQVWISRRGRPSYAYRFDVVGVLWAGSDTRPGSRSAPGLGSGGSVRVRHVENAFFSRRLP